MRGYTTEFFAGSGTIVHKLVGIKSIIPTQSAPFPQQERELSPYQSSQHVTNPYQGHIPPWVGLSLELEIPFLRESTAVVPCKVAPSLTSLTFRGTVFDTSKAPRALCLATLGRLLKPPMSCRAAAGLMGRQHSRSSVAHDSVASSHRDSPSWPMSFCTSLIECEASHRQHRCGTW